MSIQRYHFEVLEEKFDVPLADALGCDDGNCVLYTDYEREMREAYKLIERHQNKSLTKCRCALCADCKAWLDEHAKYAPKEANRG